MTAFDTIRQDAIYALRLMRRRPGPALVAILSLALGIGANTAIFSVINALMLRPLPVREPERLVELLTTYPGDPRMNVFGSRYYEHYRDHNHVFSELIAMSPAKFQVAADGRDAREVEALDGGYVTGTFFADLGLKPALGRLIGPGDEAAPAGDTAVAVISWSYWQRRFAGSTTILNRPMLVNGVSTLVIGVASPTFQGIQVGLTPDLWMPTSMEPLIQRPSRLASGQLAMQLLARLKPGVTLQQARAEMRLLDRVRAEDMARVSNDPQWRQVRLDVEPAPAGVSALGQYLARPLLVLQAIVALLLVLACLNIASMLLAQSGYRRREMAVRVTLGAGGLRLARQLLTESLFLSAAGGMLGLGVAYVGAVALVRAWPIDPRWHAAPLDVPVYPDWRVFLFTAVIALLTGVLFGLAPVWQALAAPAFQALRSGTTGETRSRRWVSRGLVVAQVAMSMALLSAAGLFVQHLSDLRYVGLGFDRTSVLLVSVDPSHSGYTRDELSRRYQDLLGRLEAIPGVRSATLSAVTPIAGGEASRFVQVEGVQEPRESRRRVSLNTVGPKYFETLGTPRLAGRDFTITDQQGPPVAIVNQAFARSYFGGDNPIGRRFTLEGQTTPTPYEIVGLVGDAKYANLHEAAPRTVYLHAFQEARGRASQFAIRTTTSPLAVVGAVRDAMRQVAANVPIARITTLSDQVDGATRPERLIAMLSGFFGVLGATLAAIGFYGLLAYAVARRTNEIGVRVALGATPRDVAFVIVKSAVVTLGAGLLAGLPLTFWSKRLAAALIGNLTIASPLPILIATIVLAGVLLMAAYVPARRAARIDPVVALRRD